MTLEARNLEFVDMSCAKIAKQIKPIFGSEARFVWAALQQYEKSGSTQY